MLKSVARAVNSGASHPSYGKKHSAETRAKLSAGRLGRKFGPLPVETRLKISKVHTGKKYSKERCQNISASLKGKMSEERKAALSNEKKGNKNSLGMKHTEEVKMIMSNKKKGNKYFLGKKHTEETLRILSEKAKIRIKNTGISDETRRKIAKFSQGEKNNFSKLTDEKVMKIRFMRIEGISTKNLSIKYNVSKSCIERILNGKSWKHLKDRQVWSTPTITEIEA